MIQWENSRVPEFYVNISVQASYPVDYSRDRIPLMSGYIELIRTDSKMNCRKVVHLHGTVREALVQALSEADWFPRDVAQRLTGVKL